MTAEHTHGHGASPENDDIDIALILKYGLALTIFTAATLAFVWWLTIVYTNRETALQPPRNYPLAAGLEDRLPATPRLQTAPRTDLADLRSDEEAVLSGYAWVDRNAGTVRIPIEAAMKLVLERGLPARAAVAPAAIDVKKLDATEAPSVEKTPAAEKK